MKDRLDFHQKQFGVKVAANSAAVSTAVFLLIPSLIVIISASLCATIPNVNIVNSVIIRGVIPGIVGVGLSIPFIILSIRISAEKKAIRKDMVEQIKVIIDHKAVSTKPKKEAIAFIEEHFLDKNWAPHYSGRLLDDVKALYPKDAAKGSPEKAMMDALDETKAGLHKKKD